MRSTCGEAQQVDTDALLEDEHEDPVGGADGQQVDGDRRQRDRDRPERQRQQDEAQRQHERDHDRQPAAVDREGVARLGRRAADEDAVRRRAERGAARSRRAGGRSAADARSLLGSTVSGTEATAMRGPLSTVSGAGGEVAVGGELGAQAGQALLRCRDRSRAPSTTMLTGSVAPLGKSRSQREQSLLGHGVVRQRRRPGRAHAAARAPGRRAPAAAPSSAIRLSAGRRMTARTARRQIGPSSPADAAMRRPSHGHAQTVDAVAEDHQQRRVERQRDDDRDQADDHRAEAEAAQGGVGHEQHRDHRQRERGAAEHDRSRRGVRRRSGSPRACRCRGGAPRAAARR